MEVLSSSLKFFTLSVSYGDADSLGLHRGCGPTGLFGRWGHFCPGGPKDLSKVTPT